MAGEPRTIGRYEVRRLLGRGAMGQVYLAFDPLLKRFLAIKTVRDFSADTDSALLRFQREAEISARLNHPNIVTVHDVGKDPEAGPFLAMEFIDGLPLSDLIQRGIPCESAIHLLLQGMSALQAAEREGITHRDVKPANILVSHDGRLKLMDFGIARGEGTRLTQTGQIIGTPSYTAPEALVGVEPSAVSDRYAFAVTAFQMLTCTLPFECPTIAATLFRIVHEPPLFPDSMAPGLRAVFEKALSKEPGDRYPDLASFMRALIAAVDLPEDLRAKFLASLAGDSGAEVAQLIQNHTQAIAINRELETQATPLPSRSRPRVVEESATELFRTPKPGASAPTVPPAPAPVPKPRPAWPRLAAGALLALALLGLGAWGLRSRGFLVDIASSPQGASVLVDGKLIGRTDLAKARIPRDGATLRLELEGYQPAERRLRREDGPVSVVLARAPATVQVVTDPPGAQAFLDGAALGTTPIKDLRVPDGRPELVLRLNGHRDWSRILEPGAALPEVIRLAPRAEAARVRSAPAPAPAPPPVPAIQAGSAARPRVEAKAKAAAEPPAANVQPEPAPVPRRPLEPVAVPPADPNQESRTRH